MLYIFSGELFPTSMRNTGIGWLSVSARCGGIVCPFLLPLGSVAPGLQFAVLGLLSCTAGLLNIYLPETARRPMPETLQDVLRLSGAVVSSLYNYYRLYYL